MSKRLSYHASEISQVTSVKRRTPLCLAPMALLIVEAILGIKNLLLGSNPLEVSKTSESKFRNGNQKQKIQAIGPLFYIRPL